jgi:putative ABC transport system substrate-binding protein
MTGTIRNISNVKIIITAIINLMIIGQLGCNTPEKTFTIGILTRFSADTLIIDGFKQEMAAQGYIENKNTKYIFIQSDEYSEKNLAAGIKELLAQDIDLLFTTGNKAALTAKQLVKGTDIPVLFSSNPWPIKSGIIESLKHPGGNLTGVRIPDTAPKSLEFIKSIAPELKKVVIPYNPEDKVSVAHFPALNQAALQLDIELVFREVDSVKRAVAVIEKLPEDVGAILMITSPTLNSGHSELSQAARKRGLISGSTVYDEVVMISLSPDILDAAQKKAHIACQIFKGNKPANLPVQTAEVTLTINVKTADQIGVKIPQVILAQATKLIR